MRRPGCAGGCGTQPHLWIDEQQRCHLLGPNVRTLGGRKSNPQLVSTLDRFNLTGVPAGNNWSQAGATPHLLARPHTPGAHDQIVAGGNAACSISNSGSAACWGSSRSACSVGLTIDCNGPHIEPVRALSSTGQLALPPDVSWRQVTAAARLGISEARLSQISLGTNHACGVTSTGRATCWGPDL
jgi:hypothetical protein